MALQFITSQQCDRCQRPVQFFLPPHDSSWGSECRDKNGGYWTAEYSDEVFLTHKWELNRGIDVFSFGFNRNSESGNYTTAQDLINTLIRTVW